MVYKSFYSILNTNICLETPSREMNDFCDYIWQNFLSENHGNNSEYIKILPSPKKENCFSVSIGGSHAICFGKILEEVPSRVISKALENVINGQAINNIDKRDMITLHSGVVGKNNKAILILGESGHGKSTFTLELVANHGWMYLTDEVGLLDAHHIVYPFLKTVSFIPDIVKLGPQWTFRHFGIDYQTAVPRDSHGLPMPLAAVVLIKYSPDNTLSLEPLKKSDSFVRLFQSQIGRAKSVASLDQIINVVKNVPSYRLNHNNASDAARMITQLLETIEQE
jgi:hypothetical protein